MKIPIKRQVPAGTYRANFSGVETKPPNKYGDVLCWTWKITAGPWKGESVDCLTGSPASITNKAGKFTTALTSLSIEQAAEVDLEAYVGTPCLIIVTLSESGYPRVESFIVEQPPDAQVPPAAAVAPF